MLREYKARRAARGIVLFCSAIACISVAFGGQPEPASPYSVTVVESKEVPYSEVKSMMVRQHVLSVTRRGDTTARLLTFGGPEHGVIDKIDVLRVVGDRLVVGAVSAFSVFDLTNGKELFFDYAEPDITVSGEGKYVAYKVLQPRFLPPEADSKIIKIVNVETLEDRPVFPSTAAITEGQFGQLLVWEDDPEKRYVVLYLYWSPDETRLLFFAKQGPRVASDHTEIKDFLGVVDLTHGLAKSKYALSLIPSEDYLKPDADIAGRIYLFNADSLRWVDARTIEVTPRPYYWWMKEKVLIQLPEVE